MATPQVGTPAALPGPPPGCWVPLEPGSVQADRSVLGAAEVTASGLSPSKCPSARAPDGSGKSGHAAPGVTQAGPQVRGLLPTPPGPPMPPQSQLMGASAPPPPPPWPGPQPCRLSPSVPNCRELQEGRDLSASSSLHSQYLDQCPAQKKRLASICWVGGWWVVGGGWVIASFSENPGSRAEPRRHPKV